jgi:hypothetical protein
VAFEGGGYLAFAIHTGLVSGLLAAFPGDAPGSLGELLREYGTISSNSGGSWYAASLTHSDHFVNITNEIAAKPDESDAIFSTWVADLLSLKGLGMPATNPECTFSRIFEWYVERLEESEAGELGPLAKENFESLLGTIWEGALTWDIYVAQMLQKASGVPEGATLGSDISQWAKGKEWLLCTSLPTPDADAPAISLPGKVWDYSLKEKNTQNIYMQASSPDLQEHCRKSDRNCQTMPQWTPTKFSVSMGAEAKNPPYPFCADEACFNYTAVYNQDGVQLTTGPLGATFSAAFTSDLPVGLTVSSSSAFAGGVAVFERFASRLANDCVDFATWVSNATGGRTYEVAKDVHDAAWLTNGSNFKDFASNSVVALVDGGYTDNTGVAWAVSAGSTEVVALINGFSSMGPLFADGPKESGICPACTLYFNVFAETMDDAQAQYTAFDNLTLASDDFEYVTAIKLGTIETTTVDCKWFGIKAGTRVTVHMLSVETQDLNIGGSFTFNNFYDYATFVQEIVTTLASADNAPVVQDALSQWFSVSE